MINDLFHQDTLVAHYTGPIEMLQFPYCNLCNPSILYHDGLYYINLRATNYTLEGTPTHCEPHPGPEYYTQNWIGTTKDPLVEPTDWKPVHRSNRKLYGSKFGLEDARLVFWKGRFYLSGTMYDFNDGGVGRICLSEIVEDKDCWYELNYHILQGTCNDCNYIEKNWMPVLDRPLRYIASTDPTYVLRANLNDNRITDVKGKNGLASCALHGCIRGSSQVVPYRGHYFAIVHFSTRDKGNQLHYFHRLAMWDIHFNLEKLTEPFKFEGDFVEFCCGMCIQDDYCYITYSAMDSNPSVVMIPIGTLINLG